MVEICNVLGNVPLHQREGLRTVLAAAIAAAYLWQLCSG